MLDSVEVTMRNGVLVHAAVAFSKPNVHEGIKKLLSAMKSDDGPKRVGLTVKKRNSSCKNMREIKTEAKSLVLCVENQCLIVQLTWHGQEILTILANFFDLPEITFVGFRIEEDLALLEKDFRLCCSKFVELGKLAAEVKQQPYLKDVGLSELASLFNLSLPLESDVLLCFEDYYDLNKTAIEYATRGAYACFYLGKAMLDINKSYVM